jgi:ADP-ribose pyrophosphatase
MKKWELLDSKMAMDIPWFKVRQDKVKLESGKILEDYYVWVSKDVAMVVPITSENKLVLVKQYKHGVGEIMLEYPAGYLDKNEKPEEAARRELEEETGYTIKEMSFLKKVIHHPTKETGCLHLFLAKVEEKRNETKFDENEEIEVCEFTIPEVMKMIEENKIWATASILATYLALEKLGKIKYEI